MFRKKQRSGSTGFKLILIAVVILIAFLIYLGNVLGIIKAKHIIYDNREDQATIPHSQITHYLVSREDDHKLYSAGFDEDGSCTLKAPSGPYQSWIDWDGIYYSDGFEVTLSTLNTTTAELVGDPDVFRCLLLQFYNEDKKLLQPQKLTITGADGSTHNYFPLSDGLFFVEFLDSVQECTLTIQADDYPAVTATADLSQSRAVKLAIMFEE